MSTPIKFGSSILKTFKDLNMPLNTFSGSQSKFQTGKVGYSRHFKKVGTGGRKFKKKEKVG